MISAKTLKLTQKPPKATQKYQNIFSDFAESFFGDIVE